MILTISILSVGFSVAVAALLLVCYAFFLKSDNKSIASIFSSGVFIVCLMALQFEHLSYIQQISEPLNSPYYRSLLLLVPPLFYFFSRYVLFVDYQFKLYELLHFAPIALIFWLDREIVVPIAFLIGTSYCLWLTYVLYRLRNYRNRFKIEFFFFVFFSVLTIGVLILGFLVSFIDDAYFYYFYTNGIALAFALVTAALIIYPDLLNELTAAVQLGYSSSTLSNIDVTERIEQIEILINEERLFQNEDLNLATMANALDLSSHQLSELINTHYGVNFSRFLRESRIKRAKELLINEPSSSVLSISLETGFKSQSNFYAAFKEITGMSPGAFRKASE